MTDTNTEQPTREFTGVFIPAFIWNHPELNWIEKCLLAEIHAIGGHRGNCFASNDYLADKMDVSPVRVRSMISHLKELRLVKQVSFDGRVRKLKTLFDSDEGERADRSKMSGRTGQVRAGRKLESERSSIVEIQEDIKDEGKKTTAPPATVKSVEPKQVVEVDQMKPTNEPPSKFTEFVRLWSESYLARIGAPYPFAGGRDGKAAKLLTGNCRTPAELVDLAAWCWANLNGYVQQQCLTIHGFQSQQAVVQALRAQREGRFKRDALTEAQKAANVAAGDGWKNDVDSF